MSTSTNVTIDLKEKGKISYPSKSEIFANDTPGETLVEKCMEEMKNNPKSILLMERVLGKIGDPKAVDPLIKTLGDYDYKVRFATLDKYAQLLLRLLDLYVKNLDKIKISTLDTMIKNISMEMYILVMSMPTRVIILEIYLKKV